MTGFAATLSEQDREDLAAYFASQKSSLYTVQYSEGLEGQ
jgi:cytochrome c553